MSIMTSLGLSGWCAELAGEDYVEPVATGHRRVIRQNMPPPAEGWRHLPVAHPLIPATGCSRLNIVKMLPPYSSRGYVEPTSFYRAVIQTMKAPVSAYGPSAGATSGAIGFKLHNVCIPVGEMSSTVLASELT